MAEWTSKQIEEMMIVLLGLIKQMEDSCKSEISIGILFRILRGKDPKTMLSLINCGRNLAVDNGFIKRTGYHHALTEAGRKRLFGTEQATEPA